MKECGNMKPMHAVNNGPSGSKVRMAMNNYSDFTDAGIPYARTHDASFSANYGGEHTVDVHRIFKNFDADENDPASYKFESTDNYLKDIESVGTKVFYRLGASIEHGQKEGTYPPKDFNKWARVCEHIISHYTEGWANGFYMDIEYWEIWNEPDCSNPDGSNPCWQGTYDEFLDMFVIVFRHLKTRFPQLKIGGPAFCTSWRDDYNKKLFDRLEKENLILDFYSFHGYRNEPYGYGEDITHAYELLKKYGCEDKTELILNEWNYLRGWTGDDYTYTMEQMRKLKGASFVLGTMCTGQKSPLSMLMYYDARMCAFCGLFEAYMLTRKKPYYSLYMFNKLYKLETEYLTESDSRDLYCLAAKKENKAAILMTNFSDRNELDSKNVKIDITGFTGDGGVKAEYYLLDEKKDLEKVREEIFNGSTFSPILKLEPYASYLIKLEKL